MLRGVVSRVVAGFRRAAPTLPDVGPYWPALPGMDYRYGFPVASVVADELDGAELDVDEITDLLVALERAAFEALTRLDIEHL